MSPRSPIAAAVLSVLLLAPAAASASGRNPPPIPVPAGQMQHTVIETTFPPDKNTHRIHGFRDERWVGHDAGRELITDTTTGKVRSDCHVTVKLSRCFWAQVRPGEGPKGTAMAMAGTLRTIPDGPRPDNAGEHRCVHRAPRDVTFLVPAVL